MMKRNGFRTCTAFQRAAAVILCLLLVWCAAVPASAGSAGAQDGTGIHLPAVEADAQTPTGVKTTWSCVLFGSYPSAEVVDSGWDAVDDYALQDGDLIRNDALFARLEAADWQDNRTELDGYAYLRVGLESAPAAGGREQHYRWEYSRPWHYFRIQPMRWRVLDIRENKALLLADRMPDSVPFHDADESVTWEECTLRSWLNGYGAEANKQGTDYTGQGLIDLAFTDEEREAVLPTQCRNLANRDYGTNSGGDTEDRLFILSNEEVFEGENAGRYGFDASRDFDDPAKRFTSTLYAKCMGAWWSPVDDYAGNSFWFMRTSGYTARSITYICDFGFIYSRGTLATCSDAGVLPAMWIDLDKAELTAAGETVSTQIMKTTVRDTDPAAAEEIGNPVIVADENAPGGMYTVWNAVAFGSYPQTEILEGPGPEAGAETDPELFRRLEAAAEEAGDEVLLEDVRYIRLENRWFRCDPIVWRVLEVADGTALLMSDKCLDSLPWHAEYVDAFWEGSGIRGWLNGTAAESGDSPYGERSFVETAFTEEELRTVTVSAVSNASNYYFGTACGSGTRDRVFLLSEEEVFSSDKAERYGFRPSDAIDDPGRRLVPTAYAVARGAWQSENEGTAGNGFWLLRTNGYTQDNVVYVGEKGYLYNRGIPVTCRDAGIVPVIRVRLGTGLMVRVEDISSKPDAPAPAEEAGEGRTAREIIEEMAVYYGTYGSEAEEKAAELLEELSAMDPALGAKWSSIMQLWETVSTGIEINEDILPDGLPDTDELCLVVLGFQLNPDGSMKDELIERLKVAKASAEKYSSAFVVCTGGGTAAENPDATEAGEMAKWLIENGVDARRVIVEDKSLTTAQNAIYTWQILTEQYPQVRQLAIISSDYHIATGTLLFAAEATLQAEEAGKEAMTVVSNAAWHAPSGTLSSMFQAGALIELSGDVETAWNIYYETYDIHELPPLK